MKRKLIALILVGTMLVSSAFTGKAEITKPDGKRTESAEKQEKEDKKDSKDKKDKKEKSEKKTDIKDRELKDLPEEWNLTELYADENAFKADMERIDELIPKIEELRGTLDSVEGILKRVEDPDLLEIDAIRSKASMYTMFLTSLDSTDSWAKKAAAMYSEASQKIAVAYAFFDPEIMEMSLKKRKEIFSDERLEPYAYYFERFTDPDYVCIPEGEAKVMTLMEPAANQYETRNILDDVELPRPEFEYPDGSKGTYSDSVYTNIITDSKYDHDFRKEMYGLRNAMRQPYANTYASLLDGQIKYFRSVAQMNGFDSSLEYQLHESDVEPEIYDRIIEFAHKLLPKIYEYYDAKKDILGLDEIMLCDFQLSVTDYEPKNISYEEAVNMGRKGISVWGDEYLETFDKIIEKPHIDVHPSDTKASGAYEDLEGNETLPFVMLNYDGNESYASTIVHEMGHAVYSEFSTENQNVFNNAPSIFTHEVASTANEIMLHKAMIENAKTDEEKIYWLDREINLFISTIVRQCMYSEFEDYCHKIVENGGSLDADDLADKWIELEKLYYGDGVTIPDDSGIDWARITHFYYGYYVYKYATSITYAASICNKVDEEGQKEIDAYLDFLKAGNTASPAQLLKIADVDPMADETYDSAEELIEGLIDEFIKTAK